MDLKYWYKWTASPYVEEVVLEVAVYRFYVKCLRYDIFVELYG